MDFKEYIMKNNTIRLDMFVELVKPAFRKARPWNRDDSYVNVMRQIDEEIYAVIEGIAVEKPEYIKYVKKDRYDEFDNPIMDNSTGNISTYIDYHESHGNCYVLLVMTQRYLLKYRNYRATEFDDCISDLARKPLAPSTNNIINSTDSGTVDVEDEIPEDIIQMDIHNLRKKVSELSVEKIKWDKSIKAALLVGLQIKDSDLPPDASKKAIAVKFEKEFKGLPKKTVDMICKTIPPDYRNIGGSPVKAPEGIDDDTVDSIIKTAAYAGYLTNKEGINFLDEIKERLTEDNYEAPGDTYLKAIMKACKKVASKYV